jgi:hypothetical protein
MQLTLSNVIRSGLAAAALVICASTGQTADTPPSIAAALFDKEHIGQLPAGTELTYIFERDGSEPKLLGPNYKDDIGLKVDEVTDDGKRTVSVRVFTGDRGREARTITGLSGNPILVFYLDRAVANFATLAGGNRAYHKNRFRIAMRTKDGLFPTTFKYKGKAVNGYKLAIRPYTGDKNVHKMKGYENAHFEVLVSDEVPGYFAEMTSSYSSPLDGSPSLKERIVIEGVEETAKAEAKIPGDKK